MKKVQKVWVVVKEEGEDGGFVLGATRTARRGRALAASDHKLLGDEVALKWVARVLVDEAGMDSCEEWRAVTIEESHDDDGPRYSVIEVPLE